MASFLNMLFPSKFSVFLQNCTNFLKYQNIANLLINAYEKFIFS